MAKSIFGSAVELRIKFPSDLWFLHPSPPPTHDTVVEGTVILSLPSARKVKKLDVELVRLSRKLLWAVVHTKADRCFIPQIGRQNMYLLKQFTKYDTIRRKLTINLHEQYGELEAGIHEFAWSFVVPSTTAPYERYAQRVFCCRSAGLGLIHSLLWNRSDYGRTYHCIKATAYGCGKFGADLVTETPELGLGRHTSSVRKDAS
jgi:hypothetical protein